MSRANLSRLAREFVEARPELSSCISQGLVNHSAVARRIIREQKLPASSSSALVAALRRIGPGKQDRSPAARLKHRITIHPGKKGVRIGIKGSVPSSVAAQLHLQLGEGVLESHYSGRELSFTVSRKHMGDALALLGRDYGR